MNTAILATKNLLSQKQIKQEKSISHNMINSPLHTTTTLTTTSILNSTENALKAVSPLSPYSEIMNDMDSFHSKMSSQIFGFDSHLNEQNNNFSPSLSFIQNNTNFIHGISTPTLSNSASTTSLPYNQDLMDFPSPSDSCASNNDGGNATVLFVKSKESNIPKDGVVLSKDSSDIQSKNKTNLSTEKPKHSNSQYMEIDDDGKKTEKLHSTSTQNKTTSNKTKSVPKTTESFYINSNSTNPLLSCFPLNNGILTPGGLLENYLSDITYPYFNSPIIPNNFQRINPSPLLTSNPLFNNIVDPEMYLKQMNQLLLLNQLTTMSSPIIPTTTIPLETLSLQNFSMPLTNPLQPSTTTDTLKTDSLLNYIDFDRKVDTPQPSLSTTPSIPAAKKKNISKNISSNSNILTTDQIQENKKFKDSNIPVKKNNEKSESVKTGSEEKVAIKKSELSKDFLGPKEATVVAQQNHTVKEISQHSSVAVKENEIQALKKKVPVLDQFLKLKEHPVSMDVDPKVITPPKESVKPIEHNKILKNNKTNKNTTGSKVHPIVTLKNQSISSKINMVPALSNLPNLTKTNVTIMANNSSTINTTPTTVKATTVTNGISSTSSPTITETTAVNSPTVITTSITSNSTPTISSIKAKSTPLSITSSFTAALPTPPATKTSTPKSILPSTTTSSITLESLSNLNMDFNDIPKTAELKNIMPILKSNVAKSCLNLLKETKGKPGRKKKSTTNKTTSSTTTSTLASVTIKTEPQSDSTTNKVTLSDSKTDIKKASIPMVDVKPVVTKSLSTPIIGQASKDTKSNPSLQKYPVLKPKSQPSNMSTPFVLSILNQIHGKTSLFPLNNGLDAKKVSSNPSLIDATTKKSPSSLPSLDKSKEVKKESIKYTNLNFKNQDFPTTTLCQSPFSLTSSPSTASMNKNLPFPLSQSLFQQMNQKLNVLSSDQPNTTATKNEKKSAYQKRQDRLLKNREAAHLSRKRKREQLHKLEAHAQELISENQQLKEKVIELEKSNISYQDEIKDIKEKYEILKNILLNSSAFKNTNLSQLMLTPTPAQSTPPPSETSTPNQKNDESAETASDNSSECASPNKKQKTNNILFMIK